MLKHALPCASVAESMCSCFRSVGIQFLANNGWLELGRSGPRCGHGRFTRISPSRSERRVPENLSGLEWGEAFLCPEPIQKFWSWLVLAFSSSERNDTIEAYESIFFLVREQKFLMGSQGDLSYARTLVWNFYEQASQLCVSRPRPAT